MAIVSDFKTVVDNTPIDIGPDPIELRFQTESSRSDTDRGLLIFSVRGLETAERRVGVRLNGEAIGFITTNPLTVNESWFTQLISFRETRFRRQGETNVLSFDIDRHAGGPRFQIKDLVCFFHQNS